MHIKNIKVQRQFLIKNRKLSYNDSLWRNEKKFEFVQRISTVGNEKYGVDEEFAI